MNVEAGRLESFATEVLAAAGMEHHEAGVVASYLVEANLRGVDGHGVMRLVQYVDSIRAGGINLRPRVRVTRRDATGIVDADGGYGFRPAQEAMALAVEIAREAGIGCVGVANSHHFGMAVLYALQASEGGCLGIAISNTTAVMPAPGGLTPLVGNNPIAVAVPRDDAPPLVVDVALSRVSWGKVSLAAAAGEPIPLGWALDRNGEETTDAEEALRASMLAPVGGHKGFALALLFELLASGLTGSPVGPMADTHGNPAGGCGHLLIAIDPEHFAGRRVLAERVEGLVDAVTGSPAKPDGGARLPGAGSLAVRARRLTEGVPLDKHLADTLKALAGELGAPPLVAEETPDPTGV